MKFIGYWLSEFWRYVAKRQEIYHHRHVLHEAPPWTRDPILQKYRFTEVYREHDRGTRYVISELLPHYLNHEDPYTAISLWFFNCAVYRKFNLPNTHILLSRLLGDGFWLTDWEPTKAAKLLNQMVEKKLTYRSNAFNLAAQGFSRENVCARIHALWLQREYYAGRLEEATSLEHAHEVLTTIPGFGGFMAMEVLQDLNYSQGPVTDFNEDEWAFIGPGAVRGLSLLLGEAPKENAELALRILHETQQQGLKETGVPWHGHKPISLNNLESCLCEWAKYEWYERSGRGKRLFNPQAAYLMDRETR